MLFLNFTKCSSYYIFLWLKNKDSLTQDNFYKKKLFGFKVGCAKTALTKKKHLLAEEYIFNVLMYLHWKFKGRHDYRSLSNFNFKNS